MEDHEKLKKISEIRKRREDRQLKIHKDAQAAMHEYEKMIEAHKMKIQSFIEERGVQLQKMQNKMRTEAVDGLLIEKYLMLKEETQTKVKELYDELEQKTEGYYPLLDKVNQSYKEWEDVNRARTKLEKIAEDKKKDFIEERDKEEELRRYADFRSPPPFREDG